MLIFLRDVCQLQIVDGATIRLHKFEHVGIRDLVLADDHLFVHVLVEDEFFLRLQLVDEVVEDLVLVTNDGEKNRETSPGQEITIFNSVFLTLLVLLSIFSLQLFRRNVVWNLNQILRLRVNQELMFRQQLTDVQVAVNNRVHQTSELRVTPRYVVRYALVLNSCQADVLLYELQVLWAAGLTRLEPTQLRRTLRRLT